MIEFQLYKSSSPQTLAVPPSPTGVSGDGDTQSQQQPIFLVTQQQPQQRGTNSVLNFIEAIVNSVCILLAVDIIYNFINQHSAGWGKQIDKFKKEVNEHSWTKGAKNFAKNLTNEVKSFWQSLTNPPEEGQIDIDMSTVDVEQKKEELEGLLVKSSSASSTEPRRIEITDGTEEDTSTNSQVTVAELPTKETTSKASTTSDSDFEPPPKPIATKPEPSPAVPPTETLETTANPTVETTPEPAKQQPETTANSVAEPPQPPKPPTLAEQISPQLEELKGIFAQNGIDLGNTEEKITFEHVFNLKEQTLPEICKKIHDIYQALEQKEKIPQDLKRYFSFFGGKSTPENFAQYKKSTTEIQDLLINAREFISYIHANHLPARK